MGVKRFQTVEIAIGLAKQYHIFTEQMCNFTVSVFCQVVQIRTLVSVLYCLLC